MDDLPSHTVDNNTLELKHLDLQDRERERESQLSLCKLELREKDSSQGLHHTISHYYNYSVKIMHYRYYIVSIVIIS